MLRRLVAILATLSLTLLVAAPALANDLFENQAADLPIAWDASGYQGDETECAGADLEPGEVLWHFVHTMTDGGDLPATLTVTFSDGTTQTVDGFTADFEGNSVVHYEVITGQTSLVSASDTIDNDGMLLLSHICSGGPPPEIPEAPASVLLVLTAAVAMAGFFIWQTRRNGAVA
jgi:hypothetical protein